MSKSSTHVKSSRPLLTLIVWHVLSIYEFDLMINDKVCDIEIWPIQINYSIICVKTKTCNLLLNKTALFIQLVFASTVVYLLYLICTYSVLAELNLAFLFLTLVALTLNLMYTSVLYLWLVGTIGERQFWSW